MLHPTKCVFLCSRSRTSPSELSTGSKHSCFTSQPMSTVALTPTHLKPSSNINKSFTRRAWHHSSVSERGGGRRAFWRELVDIRASTMASPSSQWTASYTMAAIGNILGSVTGSYHQPLRQQLGRKRREQRGSRLGERPFCHLSFAEQPAKSPALNVPGLYVWRVLKLHLWKKLLSKRSCEQKANGIIWGCAACEHAPVHWHCRRQKVAS